MSQHDFDIANQTASAARADINLGLKALASQSSGATAPATTYANMMWYDTTNNILKVRDEANSVWINVGYVDQSGSVYSLLDDTKVVNTSGTQTGLLGDQSTATWEAGTSTAESLVSPSKVKAAIGASTKRYESVTGQQPIASSTLTFAHGLGVEPDFINLIAENTTADAGFSIGDRLALALSYGQNNIGLSVWSDSTNIYVAISSSGLDVPHKTTFGTVFINDTSWDIHAKAFSFT